MGKGLKGRNTNQRDADEFSRHGVAALLLCRLWLFKGPQIKIRQKPLPRKKAERTFPSARDFSADD